MSEVRVSIGSLSLDGFGLTAREARHVRRGVEAELTRLLAGGRLPLLLTEGGATGRLSRRPLEVTEWNDPADLGMQVGRALFQSLSRGARTPGGPRGTAH
jgi:hypothetical protein